MRLLCTGTAGFIGYHLSERMLKRGDEIIGVDSINAYYDPQLKYDRLKNLGIDYSTLEYGKEQKSSIHPNFSFIRCNLEDKESIDSIFKNGRFDKVCNLAAQAGVRYSIKNPYAYLDSNITGFLNILEASRHNEVAHLVYASSSSVYGLNTRMPFSIHHNVDHPISLYAASKKSNELMAHTYSYLYKVPTSGLRFFTVYGPWGRPDMALFIFTKNILEGKPIQIFNNGNMKRDFTYIDDIVEGIVRIIDNPPVSNSQWSGDNPDPASSPAPYRVSNIGNSNPVLLMDFIHQIEKELGVEAIKDFQPIQPGDVPATWSDVSDLEREFGYKPETTVVTGIKNFISWYKDYYNAN